MPTPQIAQVILAGIAASMMTVVFAILLMTLTLASMQFSPRVIVSFAKDWVTQWTLGIFLGTFSYCMVALPARSLPHPLAPVTTVLGAMLLALLCVGWLLFFIHHISQAISVNHIVDRIGKETEGLLYDPPGVVRVSIGWIQFERLSRCPDLAFRCMLAERGLRTVIGSVERLDEDEMKELRARQAALESRTVVSAEGLDGAVS